MLLSKFTYFQFHCLKYLVLLQNKGIVFKDYLFLGPLRNRKSTGILVIVKNTYFFLKFSQRQTFLLKLIMLTSLQCFYSFEENFSWS